MGNTLAWTSQISEELLDGKLGFPVTVDQLGWVGSFMPLGAATLSLFIGPLADLFGRKLSMLLLIIPATLGWCLLIWPQNVEMLYSGRFITGMVAGAFCVLSLIYSSEIAQKEIRGALGSYTQMMISGGILFANVLAKFLTIQVYTIACAAIPIVFGAIFVFMPESPIFLMKKDKVHQARASLLRLRGKGYDVEEEIKEIENNLKEYQMHSGMEVVKASLKKSSSQKACVIGLALMIFKSANGIDAITAYTSYIFENVRMGLDSKYGTIILNVFQVASAVVQSLVVDRLGRRLLLWLSAAIMTVCLILVGLTLTLKENYIVAPEYHIYIDYVPLVALVVFTIAFSLGLGPIPWLMMGEIFPPEIKSLAASVATFISWLAAFAVTKIFLVVEDNLGGDIVFYIFAVVTTIAVVFTLALVPETKNKTFNEIQQSLN